MSIPGKLLVAALAAVAVAAVFAAVTGAGFLALLVSNAVAAAVAVLASHRALPMPGALRAGVAAPAGDAGGGGTGAGPREEGTVKWFNATKGFGFVIRPGGDEVFVHYRSIRGSGRRSLRDGQRVRYHVAQTAKGPQAEDVEALD